MKPKLILRLAAAIMLLHTIGHSFGALTWQEAPNSTIAHVVEGMKNEHFVFMGRQSSLADFYQGYGIAMIFMLLMVTVQLWVFSNFIENRLTRKLLPLTTVLLLMLGITEWIYFFPLASGMTLLSTILAGWTAIRLIKSIHTNFDQPALNPLG